MLARRKPRLLATCLEGHIAEVYHLISYCSSCIPEFHEACQKCEVLKLQVISGIALPF